MKFTKTRMFALVMALILSTLTACSNSGAPSSSGTTPPPSETTTPPSSSAVSSEPSRPTNSQSEEPQQQASALPQKDNPGESNISKASTVEQPQESVPHTNPFTLDPDGGYDLYVYNGLLLSYIQINPYWLPSDNVGPEFKTAVSTINNLPTLEKVDTVPTQNAQYGLMSVAQDYSKVQFFLYEDLLTVNSAAYAITNEQYKTLKTAMSVEIADGIATPQWFAYMNPNRVTKILCKDEQGEMTEIKKENIPFSAVALKTIDVKSVKTYTPGSKNLDNSPFKAVYTFDNGITYTVYVSDDTSRAGNVIFYVESSDMNYACEYVSNTYISNYTEYTREAIDGPVNPWTM